MPGNTNVGRTDIKRSSVAECFKTELKVGSVVIFHITRSQKTCHVVGGESFGGVWKDLPDGLYYPAVGFNDCKRARVQLRLGDGPNDESDPDSGLFMSSTDEEECFGEFDCDSDGQFNGEDPESDSGAGEPEMGGEEALA